jgi:hypothetical protein
VGSELFFSNDLDTILLGGSAEPFFYPPSLWLSSPNSPDFARYFRLTPETMGFLVDYYGKMEDAWSRDCQKLEKLRQTHADHQNRLDPPERLEVAIRAFTEEAREIEYSG